MVSANEVQQRAAFLGETLFHFLGSGEDQKLFDIFDSIARRGLLMTVGNKDGKLDRFSVSMTGGITESFEVMQPARVCFTDIHEKLLSEHCEHYGKFGIGFARETILSWGGNPVVYLPNHPAPATLEGTMGTMLYCLHRVPLLMAALRACMALGNAPLNISKTTLVGVDRDAYINQADFSLRRMWAFVKEMSSQDKNDYQYLYEREWRIVDGAVMPGCEITRALLEEEVKELAAKRERWSKPLDIRDQNISHQYSNTPMLSLFRYFNGLPGRTVSQAIDRILVPNDTLKQRVLEYMEAHPNRFQKPKPIVHVFGATG
jgi:hypothetical protein